MPSTKQLGELITAVKNAVSLSEKKRILMANRHNALTEIIHINYKINPFVALPDSEPPYTKSTLPYPYNDARLYTAWKQYYLFRNRQAKKHVVEMRFIQLLEALHAEEAQILIDAHLGKLDLGVPVSVINQLYGLAIPTKEEPILYVSPPPAEEPETPPAPPVEPETPPAPPPEVPPVTPPPAPEAEPKPKTKRRPKNEVR